MRRLTLVAALLATVVGGMTAKPAMAQEILLEGPLAGAPAVRKMVQYRKLRFSVGPQFGYTLLNDYMHNFMPGAKLEFNFTDWLAVGVSGFYAFNAPTKLTNHISESRGLSGQPTVPSDSNWPSYTGSHNFEKQVAKLKSMLLAQVAIAPLRGKLNAFSKLVVAIDGYLFLGGGAVIFKERKPCSGAACGDIRNYQLGGGSVQLTTVTRGTVTFGLGFTAYINQLVGINFEYRLAPFKWNAAGTDESGQAGTQWVIEESPLGRDDAVAWRSVAEGSGDYPDGNINKDDRVWNANQSIIIGVMFHLPTKARITD